MFLNYVKIALRNMFRQKAYVLINIMGLAVGFACSIMIFLFVMHEISFDRFNTKFDRIYRLVLEGRLNDAEFRGAWTSAPTARAFQEEFPEVESAIRMTSLDETLVRIDDRKYIEDKIVMADSSFFDIFSIPLLEGNPEKALASPLNVVLTESQARKYYGNQSVIGRYLRIGNDTALYTITGIMADVPENSHFDFTMLVSFLSHPRAQDDSWLSNSFATYILLREGADRDAVQEKIPGIIEKYVGPQVQQILGIDLEAFAAAGNEYGLFLQPLSDVHMNPEIASDFRMPTDSKYIYIFSVVAILILVVASINYMNLATARSIRRSREVGLRKVVGSSQGQLVRQFLSESVMISLISVALGILLVELAMPFFNNMLQTQLKLRYFEPWYFIPGLLLLTMLIGFLSGSYPSFFLASFRPVSVLYGKLKTGMGNIRIRSLLVVVQFTISIALVISSIVIYRQIRYMLNKDLGFNKEQLLVIRRAGALRNQIPAFQEEVNKIPGVILSANSTSIPGYPNSNNAFMVEGKPAEDLFMYWVNYVDYDFLATYGITLKDGRLFERNHATDSFAVVINETGVKNYGFEDPFQVRLIQPGDNPSDMDYFDVIGVVNDFHYQSLRQTIEPCAFFIKPNTWDWAGYLTIRLDISDMDRTINRIESTWQSFTDNEPFQYFFLDQEFEKFYQQEKQTGNISVAFAVLAIFIACLGLFGLTSFATEQRARDISLRKVMGAPVSSIIILFTREISLLVVVSAFLSWILSYFAMQKWLQNFYYRIDLSPWEFILAFLVTLVISFLTVSYRTFRAATANPAEVLKYE